MVQVIQVCKLHRTVWYVHFPLRCVLLTLIHSGLFPSFNPLSPMP